MAGSSVGAGVAGAQAHMDVAMHCVAVVANLVGHEYEILGNCPDVLRQARKS